MGDILENDNNNNNNKRKLRKITCEWDEKNTKKLIRSVRNHRVLWDPTHHDYKNRSMREWEWKIIGVEIFQNENLAGEVCIKWQNLRSQYNNYSKKYKFGNNNNKNIRWKYFNMLQFLSPETETEPDIQSVVFNFDTTVIKSELNIPFEEEKKSHYQIDCNNINVEHAEIVDKNLKINQETETTPVTTSNIITNYNSSKLQKLPNTTDYLLTTNLNTSLTDEYSDFGKFVANELRNLQFASDLQSKLKRQIQRYIVDTADEFALRLNTTPSLKNMKEADSSLSSITSSMTNTSSSAIEYFTECKVERED